MGFRPQHSTNHALTMFSTDIVKKLNIKHATVACFIDVEKTFDTVWIEALIYKMKNCYSFPNYLYCLIHSFLTNRTFTVCNNDEQSEVYNIAAGVPQGSILGSVLYNIYLADLPEPPPGVNIICYADDIVTYTSGSKLNSMCSTLNLYLE